MPQPRSWCANRRAHLRFIVHLEHGVTADLPATAAALDERTRRQVLTTALDLRVRRPDGSRIVNHR
jgi:hypothetical protein